MCVDYLFFVSGNLLVRLDQLVNVEICGVNYTCVVCRFNDFASIFRTRHRTVYLTRYKIVHVQPVKFVNYCRGKYDHRMKHDHHTFLISSEKVLSPGDDFSPVAPVIVNMRSGQELDGICRLNDLDKSLDRQIVVTNRQPVANEGSNKVISEFVDFFLKKAENYGQLRQWRFSYKALRQMLSEAASRFSSDDSFVDEIIASPDKVADICVLFFLVLF